MLNDLKTKVIAKYSEATTKQKYIYLGAGVVVACVFVFGVHAAFSHKTVKPIIEEKNKPAEKVDFAKFVQKKNTSDSVAAMNVPKQTQTLDLSNNKQYQEKIAKEIKENAKNMATKDDIKLLLTQFEELNKNTQEKINEQENIQSLQIASLQKQITAFEKTIRKVIAENPVIVPNKDFSVTSIIWVNGNQLVNVHVNSTDTDRSLRVGQDYMGWNLVSIDHNCVSFKNDKGVNKQCL